MSDVEKRREVRETEAPTDTVRRIINIIFTLIGFLLVFRFVFLILGANPNNQFVDTIYNVTAPMVAIFTGIFEERDFGQGVLEPATLIALVVLFIVSWAIQSLFAKRTVRREEYIEEDRRDDAAVSKENVTTKETVRTEKRAIRDDDVRENEPEANDEGITQTQRRNEAQANDPSQSTGTADETRRQPRREISEDPSRSKKVKEEYVEETHSEKETKE